MSRKRTAHVPTPFVGDFQDHLTFNGRPPRTLAELQFAKAEYEHRQRAAEIRALSKKLALLDPFVEPILKAGIRLSYRDLSSADHGKVIRVQPVYTVPGRDRKLYEILIALGFKEVERKDWGLNNLLVTLKHGRALLVRIEIPGPAMETACAS
ncbi:hypothetical protein OU995_21400 [Roseateles sp. SL47]|uniref:hypothetical protein n=1 Tax=Roseateles sp. SL47 TaxID=2995138 RepID=UPI00226F79D3|nr:hypothetical protein [Roseateles sp. SL47]WAC72100.1 hypothetical protein OU995_21400 [Roseateles sp. SL47]